MAGGWPGRWLGGWVGGWLGGGTTEEAPPLDEGDVGTIVGNNLRIRLRDANTINALPNGIKDEATQRSIRILERVINKILVGLKAHLDDEE